ncbi:acetoin utilization protein AcuC [Jannaschia sp. LMIT008]|uniref:acetoin utilization protein AcuC n=1 Tax=Jannaschia maritima TaxID=3032585 RepID=UPI002811C8EB|nr:acetoin utilization protein AcuC [Jannaschia sp. LMIT008]
MLGHDIYRGSSYGPWHPLRVPRVSTVMDLSRALGWLPRDRFVRSPRAKPDALRVWHTATYVGALRDAETAGEVTDAVRDRHGLGTTACPVFPEVWRRPATSAGASFLAGDLVARGGVVHHPGGGTHHAMPDRASGFCYLNDPVLTILSVRRAGARRVAYVDIDAHHMDGVEHAFRDDPETLLISYHEERRWPFTGHLSDGGIGQVFNLPVPRGLNDTEAGAIRDALIVPLLERMAPDAIVIQCGADCLEEDPLSRLALSNRLYADTMRAVLPLAPRVVVLGGGGYNPWSVGRCWTLLWGVIAGRDVPDRLPAEAEDVLRGLEFRGNSRGRNPPDHWFTTLQDEGRPGPVRAEVTDRIEALRTRDDVLIP